MWTGSLGETNHGATGAAYCMKSGMIADAVLRIKRWHAGEGELFAGEGVTGKPICGSAVEVGHELLRVSRWAIAALR